VVINYRIYCNSRPFGLSRTSESLGVPFLTLLLPSLISGPNIGVWSALGLRGGPTVGSPRSSYMRPHLSEGVGLQRHHNQVRSGVPEADAIWVLFGVKSFKNCQKCSIIKFYQILSENSEINLYFCWRNHVLLVWTNRMNATYCKLKVMFLSQTMIDTVVQNNELLYWT